MDNFEHTEDNTEQINMQKDLLKLIRVLDDCIENLDSFYYYTMKKQMLAGSNQN